MGRGAFDSEGSRGAGGAVDQAAQRGAGSGEGDARRSERARVKDAIVAKKEKKVLRIYGT